MSRRITVLITLVATGLTGCGAGAAKRQIAQRRVAHRHSSRSRTVSVPWRLVRTSGRTVTVGSAAGGCLAFSRALATETPRTVTITVLDRAYAPGRDGACTANVTYSPATLTFGASVGARRLRHAPVTPDYDR